jgi:hypothetical protein
MNELIGIPLEYSRELKTMVSMTDPGVEECFKATPTSQWQLGVRKLDEGFVMFVTNESWYFVVRFGPTFATQNDAVIELYSYAKKLGMISSAEAQA